MTPRPCTTSDLEALLEHSATLDLADAWRMASTPPRPSSLEPHPHDGVRVAQPALAVRGAW
jgi:hypothetical protein